MNDKETEALRKKIAQYISKEMRLSQTPSYSLSAEEQSYGIINLLKEAGGVFLDPDQSFPANFKRIIE